MSTEDKKDSISAANSEIAKKTKNILKDQGYEVKLSHVYELFSKLSGVKDWNAAKAMSKDFKAVIPKNVLKGIPFLSRPLGDDEFYLGNKESGEENIVNLITSPGAFMVGAMGSGKSSSAFTSLALKVLSSDNTLIFIIDPIKGAVDYKSLFQFQRVIPILNDETLVSPALDLLKTELSARKDLFMKAGASNIEHYEKITGKSLGRIILHFEEFHAIPGMLKYFLNVDRVGSSAENLKTLCRVGRSYGISIIATSARATSDELPSSLKPGFSNLLSFRTNNPSDSFALNLPEAANIKPHERGRAASLDGVVQWPWIEDELWTQYLSQAPKDKVPQMAHITKDLLKEIKLGKFENFLPKKTVAEVLSDAQPKGIVSVIKQIFETKGYEVKDEQGKYDIHFSVVKDGKKSLVMVKATEFVMSKHVPILKEAMKKDGFESAFVVVPTKILGREEWNSYGSDGTIELLDKEDLAFW